MHRIVGSLYCTLEINIKPSVNYTEIKKKNPRHLVIAQESFLRYYGNEE